MILFAGALPPTMSRTSEAGSAANQSSARPGAFRRQSTRGRSSPAGRCPGSRPWRRHICRSARGGRRGFAAKALGLGRPPHLGLDRRHVRGLSPVLRLRLRPAPESPQSERPACPHPADPRLLRYERDEWLQTACSERHPLPSEGRFS